MRRIRRQRWLQGCYYVGCFGPVAFTGLLILIGVTALRKRLNGS